MSFQESDNMTRFQEGIKPFYEIYFFKFHLIQEEIAFWIRFTLHNPLQGAPYGCLWGMMFDRNNPQNRKGAIKKFNLNEIKIEKDIFHLQFGKSAIFQNGSYGGFKEKDFEIEWDLHFPLNQHSLRTYPYSLLYHLPFPKTKTVTPNLSVLYSGKIRCQGKEYLVKEAPGAQGHLWGTQHAKEWAWGHCNHFKEDSSAIFEGLSAQVKIGPWLTPHFNLFYIRLFGRDYYLNSPLRWFRNKSEYNLNQWNFEAIQGKDRFVGRVTPHPEQMLGVRYTDPDGSHRYCHHDEWAQIKLEHFQLKKGKWNLQVMLHSQAMAFELVDSEIHSPIEMTVLG